MNHIHIKKKKSPGLLFLWNLAVYTQKYYNIYESLIENKLINFLQWIIRVKSVWFCNKFKPVNCNKTLEKPNYYIILKFSHISLS